MLCTRMYTAYEFHGIFSSIQQWYEVVNKVFATKKSLAS